MAPLGIITIIVSAIRVGGPSWLRAIIGRARENLAAAEVELLSSTSKEVCELWNGSEIIRSLGSPPVKEFICLVPRAVDGAVSMVNNKPEIECIPVSRAREQGYLIAPANPRTPITNKVPTEKSTPKIIITRNMCPEAPNISLNAHTQKRSEVQIIAVIGTLLQMGALVWFAVVTYYLKYPKEEEDDKKEPVAEYSFPCTAAGTVLLVIGLLLCANVVEGRTEELTYRIKDGYEARTIWVQQKTTVGDQDFGSFAIFAKEPQTEITTSRRARDDSPFTPLDRFIDIISLVRLVRHIKAVFSRKTTDSQAKAMAKDSMRFSQTVIGTMIGLLGYVAQFVGFRGMHYSVSLVQLGAVLAMTGARAFVRRGLAKPPQGIPLSQGFELEWLASAIADRDDGPWRDDASDGSICGGSWRISTGGAADAKAFHSPARSPSRVKQEPETNLENTARNTMVAIKDDPHDKTNGEDEEGIQIANTSSNTPSHSGQTKAQTVMELRCQLARLAGWQSAVSPEATSLARAIEVVMKLLFSETDQEILVWSLEAKYGDRGRESINVSLRRKNGNWTASRHELEAILSLWLYSLHGQENVKTALDEEEVDSSPTDQPSIRLLGQNTRQLRRDLWWWMPRDIRPAISVEKSTDGHLKVPRSRIVGQGKGVPTCCYELPMTAITSFVKTEYVHDADAQTDDEINESCFLATEPFISQKSLFTLDLFSSFMGSVAKTLTKPISDLADILSNNTSGVDSRKSLSLHNELLSKMVNEIHSTGLGDLTEIWATVVSPLSRENKLPQVDVLIELARSHTERYERQGSMTRAWKEYLWLVRTARTFPIDSNIAAKIMAVMLEFLGQIGNEMVTWKYRDGSTASTKLQHSIEEELGVGKADAMERFGKLMNLYQLQNRMERFSPRLRNLATSDKVFPQVFHYTQWHHHAMNTGAVDIPYVHPEHDITGWTPLHYAAALGNHSSVIKLLQFGADIHARDFVGWTPLHYACQGGHIIPVKLLIWQRANVNAQGRNGVAPLHCGAIYGHLPVV
ncbi:hypothetical protein ACHAPJ_011837 [Fusarium lateritium]